MSFVFGNRPCYCPKKALEAAQRHGLPAELWLRKNPNSFLTSLGGAPGRGALLMMLADLYEGFGVDSLIVTPSPDKFRDLVITDPYGGKPLTIKDLLIVGCMEAVTPGHKNDPNTLYLVEVADERWLYYDRGKPLEKAYNLRSDADGSLVTDTLNGGVEWTWQQILTDIWPASLGTCPTLPFAPDGTPGGFWFHEETPLQAVDYLLTRLCCALRRDPSTGDYTIVQLGHAFDNPAIAVLEKHDALRIWDRNPFVSRTGAYPEKIRVQFRVKPPYDDGKPAFYEIDKDVTPVAAEVAEQTYLLLEDDLAALWDGSNFTNDAALEARADERLEDWTRKRHFCDWSEARTYSGACDLTDALGSNWIRLGWEDRDGRGLQTSIASASVPGSQRIFPVNFPARGSVIGMFPNTFIRESEWSIDFASKGFPVEWWKRHDYVEVAAAGTGCCDPDAMQGGDITGCCPPMLGDGDVDGCVILLTYRCPGPLGSAIQFSFSASPSGFSFMGVANNTGTNTGSGVWGQQVCPGAPPASVGNIVSIDIWAGSSTVVNPGPCPFEIPGVTPEALLAAIPGGANSYCLCEDVSWGGGGDPPPVGTDPPPDDGGGWVGNCPFPCPPGYYQQPDCRCIFTGSGPPMAQPVASGSRSGGKSGGGCAGCGGGKAPPSIPGYTFVSSECHCQSNGDASLGGILGEGLGDETVEDHLTYQVMAGGATVSDGDYGDITVSGGGTVWTIDNDVVTFAKMQNASVASRVIGRGSGGGGGDFEELTPTQGVGISGASIVIAPPTRVHTAVGDVTVSRATDLNGYIIVNKSIAAATNANLPSSPTTGDVYTVKDGKGDTATNNITIIPAAGNIEGAANYVMATNYQATTVVYSGSEWLIV